MKIGFVASCFDLGPHAGHIVMLKEAKENCDYLIAALHVDPSRERPSKNKPVQSAAERYLSLKACRYVDEVIPYETEEDLKNLLLLIMPAVRFLGSDYEDKPFTGKDIEDIQIHYCERLHPVSSSRLRQLIIRDFETKTIGPKTQV